MPLCSGALSSPQLTSSFWFISCCKPWGQITPLLGTKYVYSLVAAAYAGTTELVSLLLEDGVDPNANGIGNKHALDGAIDSSNVACAKLLLMHGADISARGGWWGSALLTAIARQESTMIPFLIDNGADINPKSGRFGNALQTATARGRSKSLDTSTLLLSMGAVVEPPGDALFEKELHEKHAILLENHGKEEKVERLKGSQADLDGYSMPAVG